jgi:excisionase family DNA binding protein
MYGTFASTKPGLPLRDPDQVEYAIMGLFEATPSLAGWRDRRLLGVSRPHLIKLLEAGELHYHKAGSHRRIYLKDMAAYQKRRDTERKAALDRIAKEAFESGLYDRTGIPEGGEDE